MSMHSAFYVETLDPELCIYMTPSSDKRHLFTSNSPPSISQERFQQDLNRDMAALSLEQDRPVMISASQSKGPLILQAKDTIKKDSEETILLGRVAIVTLPDITPCSILLNIGENHSRCIVFPYPIDGDRAKTRIARKSLWIEVTVPAASALVSGGYDSQPFPVIINEDKQPSSWSLPRIDLSKQPAMSPMDPDAWLADCFDQFVSVREEKLIDLGHPRTPDFRSFLQFFKKTLLQKSMHVADEVKVFVLAGVNERADVWYIDRCKLSSTWPRNRYNTSRCVDCSSPALREV